MTEEQLAETLGRRPDAALTRARACMDALLVALDTAPDAAARSAALAEHMGGQHLIDLRYLRGSDREAWDRGIVRARGHRGLGRALDTLERSCSPGRLRIATDDDGKADDDGLPDGHVMPAGYTVAKTGVWVDKGEAGDELVAHRPLWLVGYLMDVDGHGHHVRLMWEQVDGTTSTAVVGLGVIADARAIVTLAGRYGVPVSSASAREVVRYLEAATAAVRGTLPVERCAGRLGWMPGGFLLGADWIGDQGRSVRLMADPALTQLGRAYTTSGTWDGWLSEAVRPARAAPSAWLAIYASVASVLARALATKSAGIDFSGETSQGKTTVLRLAASVWGHPDASMRNWKVSPAGLEAHATTLQHLPVVLDDTKNARKAEDVSSMVYMLSTGTGAVRGTPGSGGRSVGQRPVSTWCSWLISTGEQQVTSFSRDAGVRARALCIVGSPLHSSEAASLITVGTLAHHGHLGRRVVPLIMADLPGLRAMFVDAKRRWTDDLTPHGAVAGRLGEAIAVLEVARVLCERAGLPSPQCRPLDAARAAAIAGGRDSDQPAAALRAVYSAAIRRPTAWWKRHTVRTVEHGKPEPVVPHGGWLGRWVDEDDWATLDVLPTVLDDLLRSHGYDAGVVDRWRERGWITHSRRTQSIRIQGNVTKAVRLSRDAFVAAGCL